MTEANKVVKGWCIEYSHQGAAPELKECEVYTTSSEGLFTQPEAPDLTRILTYGVTFFYDLVPAMKGLLERLEDAREGHLMAIAYIEDQIEMARAVLKAEEKKKQDESGGARPRC